MTKSISIKMVISLVAIILLINIFYIPASHAMGKVMQSGKNFLTSSDYDEEGNSIQLPISEPLLKETSNYIYSILLSIAIVVAVIVAMVLGIQFMWAAADEKAKIKEALMPFIAGCIVAFGAFTIWKIAISIGNSAESAITESTPHREDIGQVEESNPTQEWPTVEQTDETKNEFNNWYKKYIEGKDNISAYTNNWNKDKWYDFFKYVKQKNYDISVISNSSYIGAIIEDYILHRND